jgi:hypothetical protein
MLSPPLTCSYCAFFKDSFVVGSPEKSLTVVIIIGARWSEKIYLWQATAYQFSPAQGQSVDLKNTSR